MVNSRCDIVEVTRREAKQQADTRGFLSEIYRREWFGGYDFIQDNLSVSVHVGTVRGLHFQAPPFAQAKLVTVLHGAIFDVAVDIRLGSPTFGHWIGNVLTAERLEQVLVPPGFAHGFGTLAPDTMVIYKVDAYYSAAHEAGIMWNDSALGIDWPFEAAAATVSEKDKRLPRLAEIETPFVYRP
jgi:dTDP-4-dehydrorhamnose 3,5-epimerase